jgi:ElaB/YqjD/DUF883 family membrane-anchored ribosome-binding protein
MSQQGQLQQITEQLAHVDRVDEALKDWQEAAEEEHEAIRLYLTRILAEQREEIIRTNERISKELQLRRDRRRNALKILKMDLDQIKLNEKKE